MGDGALKACLFFYFHLSLHPYQTKAVILLAFPGVRRSTEDGFNSLRIIFLSLPTVHASYFSICGLSLLKSLILLHK